MKVGELVRSTVVGPSRCVYIITEVVDNEHVHLKELYGFYLTSTRSPKHYPIRLLRCVTKEELEEDVKVLVSLAQRL